MASVLPDVDVRYRGLSLSVKLPGGDKGPASGLDTVFGKLASLPGLVVQRLRDRVSGKPASVREVKLLDDVSGAISPGRLCLLLGAPGSGKSSLLKALTHRLADTRQLRGDVWYSGRTVAEARRAGIQPGQLVQYVSQLDEHSPFLTVRETLTFVARNSLAGVGSDAATQRVQEVMDLLHLNGCADTLIGNDLLRGVSGGEKKRVTVGEGLITNARFLALDEISTGLDASVTRKIIASLKERAVSGRVAVLVALLQPTPEIFALFDDIILLRDGAEVYHGPRTALPGYLRDLGFLPPDEVTLHRLQQPLQHAEVAARKTDLSALDGVSLDGDFASDLADWLSEWVTYPARRHRKDLRARGVNAETVPEWPPISTASLVAAWKAHHLYDALLSPAPASAYAPPQLLALESELARKQYAHHCVHHPMFHLAQVVRRQALLLVRNRAFLVFRFFSAAFMGSLIGALYFQGGVNRGLNYFGLFLNTVMFLSFCNVGEMSPTIALKYIGYRQSDNGSYPSWTFPVAAALVHLPVALVETLIFGSLVYWMAGLTPEASRFAFYLLIAFTADVFAASTFRLFAYAFPTLIAAQTVPMPIIAVFMLFAGFLITPNKMGWLKFVYYVDPYAYATKSLAQNEFLAPRYGAIPPIGPGDKTLGQLYLEAFGLPLDPAWQWGGVAFTAIYAATLVALTVLAFVYIRFDRNIGSVRATEEDDTVAVPQRAASMLKIASVGSLAVAVKKAGGPKIETDASEPLLLASERAPLLRSAPAHSHSRSSTGSSNSLPFVPAAVAFTSIVYTVRVPRKLQAIVSPSLSRSTFAEKGVSAVQRKLLRGVCGYAEPGRMLALMGASGAGKTTLLDVLAGRKNSGVMTGGIYLRGFPKDSHFNRFVAYCEQNDLHMPLTTVREALETSAALRLVSSSASAEARADYVSELLVLLELEHLAERKVGEPGLTDGLAPGERKRLTIGVELCANAPVLFLDEPTSGLDARAAASVVRVLRNVASRGRTIVCTVHQPSYEVFSCFDDLLLLQQGGWQVYFGPLGAQCEALIAYLQALPGVPPCPHGGNPASWMLDVLASATQVVPGSGSDPVSESTPYAVLQMGTPATPPPPGLLCGQELQEAYFASRLWQSTHSARLAALSRRDGVAEARTTDEPDSGSRSLAVQLTVLTLREYRTAARDVSFNGGRLAALLFLQLLYGVVYFRIFLSATDVGGLQSLCAAIFNTNAFAAFINLNSGLPGAMRARPVFYRETAALMYHPWAYQLAVFFAEVPWLALCLAVGPTISYFMIGLGTSGGAFAFAVNYLTLVLLSLTCVLLGNTVANSMPSFEMAQAAIGAITPVLMLYAGLYSKVSAMPAGSAWIHTIDPIGYAFSVFLPLHLHCAGADCPTVDYPVPGEGIVPVPRSDLVDQLYGVSYADLWPNVGYLATFVGGFLLTNSLATRFVRHIVR